MMFGHVSPFMSDIFSTREDIKKSPNVGPTLTNCDGSIAPCLFTRVQCVLRSSFFEGLDAVTTRLIK